MSAYEDYLSVFRKDFQMEDVTAVDVSLAIAVTARVSGDPLWVYIVGPPASGKTEIVRPFAGTTDIAHCLSSLGPNSLISGYSRDGSNDLLPLLHKKTLVVKDFTTILEMHRDARDIIFGQLRDCYDGSFTRHMGTRGSVTADSHFNFLSCVTTAIEEYYSAQSVLGQRFLMARMPPLDEYKRLILDDERDILDIRKRLTGLFSKFITEHPLDGWSMPALSNGYGDEIRNLAAIVAVLRTHVRRESGTHDITSRPEPEAPPRLANQLIKLAQGAAYAHDASAIGEEEMKVVRRIASDTIPSLRMDCLSAVLAGIPTIDAIADTLHIHSRTVDRKLEELVMLRCVDVNKSDKPHIYSLSERKGLKGIVKDVYPNVGGSSVTTFDPPTHGYIKQERITTKYERDTAILAAAKELQEFTEAELQDKVHDIAQPRDIIDAIANWKKAGEIYSPHNDGRWKFA